MTRLVTTRTQRLSTEQVGTLWDLIKASRDKDKRFFEKAILGKEALKRGHIGELDTVPEDQRVVANLAHSHVKTVVPTLFFKVPTANVRSTHPKYESKAAIWGALLNNTAKKISLKKELKAAVLDCVVYAEGWLKVGINKVDLDLVSGKTPKPKNTSVGPNIEAGQDKGPTEWLTRGAPFVARISPLCIVVDYMSYDRSPEGARFIDIMYIKTRAEFENDPKYKLPANYKYGSDNKTSGGNPALSVAPLFLNPNSNIFMSGYPEEFVILHEVWVYQLVQLKLYKQLVCLVEGPDGLISTTPVRFLPGGNLPGWEDVLGEDINTYPLARLIKNDIPDEVPNSDLAISSGLFSTVNWLLTRLIQSVDQTKQLFELDVTMVEDKDKTKNEFRGAAMRDIIEKKGQNPAFTPVPNQIASRDENMLWNTVFELLRRTTGISENRLGSDKFRTATAASQAAQSDAIKQDDEIDAVREFLKVIYGLLARIILSLVKEDRDTSYIFRVVGETGSEEWLRFTPEDIAWLPDIDIEADSFTKPTKEEEAQKCLMALQALLQTIPAGVQGRTEVLLRQVFEALEIKNIDQILDNSLDQMLLQATEMALILGGIDTPVNETDNDIAHIKIIDMFLNTSQAQKVANDSPERLNALLMHRDMHEQRIKGTQMPTSNTGVTNVFEKGDNFNPEFVPTESNLARQATAKEREATQNSRLSGGGGQF